MRLGKRQQARRIPPPPTVREAMPPPRPPMATFPTGPYEPPPPGYAPDGPPTAAYGPDGMPWVGPAPDGPHGYAPDGMPWMGPAPDGPPTAAYGPDGMPWVGPAPDGPPTAAYGPDGAPVPNAPDAMPWAGSGPDGVPNMAYAYGPDGMPLLYGTEGPPMGYVADGPPPWYGPDAPMVHPPDGSPSAPMSGYGPGPAAPVEPAAVEPAPPVEPAAPDEPAQARPAPGPASLAITPEPPQVTWEPEPTGDAQADDALPWPDFAPINRVGEDGIGDAAGVERLPTATQAHRLRLARPVDHATTPRATDARLARLHLRGGMIGLAQASLEQLAGVGTLDREALADLAETRWRRDDLEGAAEAAEAHLMARGDEPIARVVAAEWAANTGRILDARQLAMQVQGQVGDGLERLFAGETRSAVWPPAAADWMDSGAMAGGRFGLLVGGAEVADADGSTWASAPMIGVDEPPAIAPAALVHATQHAAGIRIAPEEAAEAEREVDRELQAAERDLARGDLVALADRLGLLLRRDPRLAPVILSLAEHALAVGAERTEVSSGLAQGAPAGTPAEPSAPLPGLASLQMLRGDILRGLGHETDATQAYQQASRALPGRAITREST